MKKKHPNQGNGRKPASPGLTKRRDWKPVFLEHLAATGNVKLAADAAGVGRRTVYDRRQAEKEFAAQWEDAVENAMDLLEAEAWRRAYEGVLEPVAQKGELVQVWVDRDGRIVSTTDAEAANKAQPNSVRLAPLMVRKYDTTLLTFMLRGGRPAKYRDHHVHQHTGNLDLRTPADGETEAAALLDDIRRGLGVAAAASAGARPAQ